MLLYRTKQRSASKGVAYGISALIWIMAIMVLIVAALIGISREIKVKSSPVSYRLTSIEAMRTSQQIYEFLDAERRNTIEQVLIYAGALGGYSPKALVLHGKEVKHLPEDFKYFPQPVVVYWVNESSGYTEIPREDEVKQNLIEFVSTGFTNPSSLLTTALTASLGYKPAISYVLDLRKLDESGIDVYWIPIGEQRFTIYLPSALSPVVKYSFDLLVHNHFNTSFFNVYEEAKNFAQGNWLVTRYFNDTNKTPIPTILDSEFLIIESNQSAPEPFDFTEQVEKNRPTPIERLVEYADTLPNHPNNCSKYNKSDFGSLVRNCQSDDCFKTVDCTLHAKRNSSGVLAIDSFSGTNCTGAVKYAMCKILNRINDELKLNMSKKTYVSGELFDSNYDYRIQIFELNLSLNSMWMEYDDYNKSGTCANASEANLQGNQFVFKDFSSNDFEFNVTLVNWSSSEKYHEESCGFFKTCRYFSIVPILTYKGDENILMPFRVVMEYSDGSKEEVGMLLVKGNRTVRSPWINLVVSSGVISVPGYVKLYYYDQNTNEEPVFEYELSGYDLPEKLKSLSDNEVDVGGEKYVCRGCTVKGPCNSAFYKECPIAGLYNCSVVSVEPIDVTEQLKCEKHEDCSVCKNLDDNYDENRCCDGICSCGVFGSSTCGDVKGVEWNKKCRPFYLSYAFEEYKGEKGIHIIVYSNESFNKTQVIIEGSNSTGKIFEKNCTIKGDGKCEVFVVSDWDSWGDEITVKAHMNESNLFYENERIEDLEKFDNCTNFIQYNTYRVKISKPSE